MRLAVSDDGRVGAALTSSVLVTLDESGDVVERQTVPSRELVRCVGFIGKSRDVAGLLGNEFLRWAADGVSPKPFPVPGHLTLAGVNDTCSRFVVESPGPLPKRSLHVWEPGQPGSLTPLGDYDVANGSPDVLISQEDRLVTVRGSDKFSFVTVGETGPKHVADVTHHGGYLYADAASDDGERIALLLEGGDLAFNAPSRAALVHSQAAPQAQFMFFGSTANSLVAISRDGEVRALQLLPRTVLRDADGEPHTSTQLEFNRDGTHLISMGEDDALRVFTHAGAPVGAAIEEAGSAEFSPDGSHLVQDPPPDTSLFSSDFAAFTAGGRLLVVGEYGGLKEVRDVAKRRLLVKLGSVDSGHYVTSVALSPEGRRAAVLHDDGTVTLREWSDASLIKQACELAGRNLSCVEWRQYLGDAPYRLTCPSQPAPEGDCQTGR